MVAVKPLTRVLVLIGVLSVGFGCVKSYAGPFFVVLLLKAGYGPEQIALIQSSFAVFWTVFSWAGIIAVALASYRYGAGYRLTMLSGFVLIVLVYLVEMLGNFLGAVICQIQIPEYPILQFSLLEIVSSYGYVYVCLIGVLAANYVRELRRQKPETNLNHGMLTPTA